MKKVLCFFMVGICAAFFTFASASPTTAKSKAIAKVMPTVSATNTPYAATPLAARLQLTMVQPFWQQNYCTTNDSSLAPKFCKTATTMVQLQPQVTSTDKNSATVKDATKTGTTGVAAKKSTPIVEQASPPDPDKGFVKTQ